MWSLCGPGKGSVGHLLLRCTFYLRERGKLTDVVVAEVGRGDNRENREVANQGVGKKQAKTEGDRSRIGRIVTSGEGEGRRL